MDDRSNQPHHQLRVNGQPHREEVALSSILSKQSRQSQRDSHHMRGGSRNANRQKHRTHGNPSEDYEYENPRRGPSPRGPELYQRSTSNNRDSKMQLDRKYTGRDERDYYRGPAAQDQHSPYQ